MSAHAWTASGRCSACAMHREWPGARAECTLRAPHEKSAQRAAQKRRAKARRAVSVDQVGGRPARRCVTGKVVRTDAHREQNRERCRARRATMGPEAVRAEWLRHQHARRERLRLAREMSEAAE